MKKTLLIIIIFYFLQACSSKKEFALNINNEDDVNLYNKVMIKLKSKEFEEAIEIFTELEVQYPYSPWASRDKYL